MSDPFASMIGHVFEALGRIAEYEGQDDETTCKVILSFDLTQWGDIITVQNNQAMISVRKSEIEDRPRRGDLFRLASGREYQVERVMVSDEYEHRLLVTEVEQ